MCNRWRDLESFWDAHDFREVALGRIPSSVLPPVLRLGLPAGLGGLGIDPSGSTTTTTTTTTSTATAVPGVPVDADGTATSAAAAAEPTARSAAVGGGDGAGVTTMANVTIVTTTTTTTTTAGLLVSASGTDQTAAAAVVASAASAAAAASSSAASASTAALNVPIDLSKSARRHPYIVVLVHGFWSFVLFLANLVTIVIVGARAVHPPFRDTADLTPRAELRLQACYLVQTCQWPPRSAGVLTFWLKGVHPHAEDAPAVVVRRYKASRALLARLMWRHAFERLCERRRASMTLHVPPRHVRPSRRHSAPLSLAMPRPARSRTAPVPESASLL